MFGHILCLQAKLLFQHEQAVYISSPSFNNKEIRILYNISDMMKWQYDAVATLTRPLSCLASASTSDFLASVLVWHLSYFCIYLWLVLF